MGNGLNIRESLNSLNVFKEALLTEWFRKEELYMIKIRGTDYNVNIFRILYTSIVGRV